MLCLIISFLEELHLSHNKIKRLPWNIHNLTILRQLYLESNQLEYLPNNIGRIKTLTSLAIMGNPLADQELLSMAVLDDILSKVLKQKVCDLLFFLFFPILDELSFLFLFRSTSLDSQVPNIYKEEARNAYKKEQEKYQKLSPDAQTLRTLLKFEEGMDAITEHCKKELSSENLLCVSIPMVLV